MAARKTIYDGLKQLGEKSRLPGAPEEAMLERVANPHPELRYLVRFAAPEFTSLCPITGQPDFAHLVIDYVPRRWLVESKSLKLYLGSFRNHGAFHEAAAAENNRGRSPNYPKGYSGGSSEPGLPPIAKGPGRWCQVLSRQAIASSSLSSPQKTSPSQTKFGAPKMPSARAASVLAVNCAAMSGASARAATASGQPRRRSVSASTCGSPGSRSSRNQVR